jgi:hypothetical protein
MEAMAEMIGFERCVNCRLPVRFEDIALCAGCNRMVCSRCSVDFDRYRLCFKCAGTYKSKLTRFVDRANEYGNALYKLFFGDR